MRVVCWNAGSLASTGIREMYWMTSGERFVASGPAKRSAAVAAIRKPNTSALGQPIGRRMRGCVPRAAGSGRASATRQEVMPRKAMKRPQPEHRVGERPVRFIQAERRVPDRVEHPGERHDTEARRGKADRARDREGDDREAERRTEPSAQIRREGDMRERDGGAQVHRV